MADWFADEQSAALTRLTHGRTSLRLWRVSHTTMFEPSSWRRQSLCTRVQEVGFAMLRDLGITLIAADNLRPSLTMAHIEINPANAGGLCRNSTKLRRSPS